MHALARLRGQVVRMRENTALRAADALDVADAALALVDDLRQEGAAMRRRCTELEGELAAHRQDTETLLNLAPVAMITTDSAGTILSANRGASLLLGRSIPRLRHDLLMHFFEDRAAFADLIRTLDDDAQLPRQLGLRMRPHERAPFDAELRLARDPRAGVRCCLWFISRVSDPRKRADTVVRAPLERRRSDPTES
jgi:PAS domain-containing protein